MNSHPRYKKASTDGVSAEVLANRAKLKARFGDRTRLGGKGTSRRKQYSHK